MRTDYTAVTVYTFDELDDEAKEKAIEGFYDLNVDYEWWDFTYEDAADIGLKITGFDIYHHQITGELTEYADNVASAIMEKHGAETGTYKLANRFLLEMDIYVDGERAKNREDYTDEDYEEEFWDYSTQEFLRALLEEYLSMLRQEYEYLTSEEAIIDTIRANEYEFTKDGKLY